MATDGGTILIKARIDLKSLEKDLSKSRAELQKYHEQADKLAKQRESIELKLDIDKQYLKDKLEKLDLRKDFELNTKRVNGDIAPEVEQKINDKYERMKEDAIARYNKQVDLAGIKIDQLNEKIKNNVTSQEQVVGEIDKTKGKIEELTQEISSRQGIQNFNDKINDAVNKAIDLKDNLKDAVSKPDFSNLNKKIDGIGKSIQGITRKVVKWGLAIFSIRSAYNMVRQAVSTITQDNEAIANQLSIIKGALASALEPIVSRVVNLVYTLLSYVNQLVKALTGKDLFANAKKNLEKGSKSATNINKQLQTAGFDEMNVLSDQSGGGGGSTAGFGDIDTNLFDFLDKYKKMLEDGQLGAVVEELTTKLGAFIDSIADKIASINWALIGQKISEVLTNINWNAILVGLARVFGEAVLGFTTMITNINWETTMANFSTGLANSIFKIDEYIKKINWGDLGKSISDAIIGTDWGAIGSAILSSIWDTLKGIVDLFLGMDWSELGQKLSDTLHTWIETAVTKIQEIDWVLLGADIADAIWNFLSNIDWVQLVMDIVNFIANGFHASAGLVMGLLSELVSRIWTYFTEEIDWEELGNNIIEGLGKGIQWFIDNSFIVKLFEEIWNSIKDFFGVHSPSTLFEGLGKNLIEGLVNGIKSLINTVVNVFSTIWTKIKNVFSGVATWFKDRFKEAWNKVKDVFSGVGEFFGGIWKTIKSKFTDIGGKIGDAVGTAFKRAINVVLDMMEGIVNKAVSGINILIKGLNVAGSILHLGKIDELKKIQLPRLAKGGIINMPGKGVAIGGESGKEGVIPLTDTQQMAILGEAIGKYITINANITNTMNGRVISRELQKINNENDFAFNR